MKLVYEFGEFASAFQDDLFVDLPCKDIQLDEIWSFCGCKEKKLRTHSKAMCGLGLLYAVIQSSLLHDL